MGAQNPVIDSTSAAPPYFQGQVFQEQAKPVFEVR